MARRKSKLLADDKVLTESLVLKRENIIPTIKYLRVCFVFSIGKCRTKEPHSL